MNTTLQSLEQAREAIKNTLDLIHLGSVEPISGRRGFVEATVKAGEMTLALIDAHLSEPDAQQATAQPVAWLRDQRGYFEGPETLDPMWILGAQNPGRGPNGATYSPLCHPPTREQAATPPSAQAPQPSLAEHLATWRKVRDEAVKLANGREIDKLMSAVDTYGASCLASGPLSDAAKRGVNCMSAWPWRTTPPSAQPKGGEV